MSLRWKHRVRTGKAQQAREAHQQQIHDRWVKAANEAAVLYAEVERRLKAEGTTDDDRIKQIAHDVFLEAKARRESNNEQATPLQAPTR